MKKQDIINQFNNMDKIPVIEIFSEGRQEYINYWLYIDETNNTIWTRGENDIIELGIDECFSLDEHLQSLYEMITESEGF